MSQFDTPILFLIFNRPELSKTVFERIRQVQPKYLYIAADGPRLNNSDDVIKCKETREQICSMVDWDCELKTLFREENLGCGMGPANAISWFFEQEKMGIILEDDCLADPSFFYYCAELLAKYESHQEIMHISGLNWQAGKQRGNYSYYFSKYPGIWGWATWADRWKKYDFKLSSLDSFIQSNKIEKVTSNKKEQKLHIDTFIEARSMSGDMHIWDYQWKYTIFNNAGICISPNKNLISNLGFGEDATHTKEITWRYKNPTESLKIPLKHPPIIKVHKKADQYTARKHFVGRTSLINKLKAIVKSILNS